MTDDIAEAHDTDGQMYGDSGSLEQVLTGFTADISAKVMVDAVINDVIVYAGGEREDGVTVVAAMMK